MKSHRAAIIRLTQSGGHHISWRETKAEAARLLETLAAQLSLDSLTAAQTRGRQRDVWQTAEALLHHTTGQLLQRPVTSATPTQPAKTPADTTEIVGEQQLRFCVSADNVRIAYATVGQGPPLVKTANWLSHLEYDWESPVWRHWLRGLAHHHHLIRYDQRGCGLSDWDVADMSVAAWLSDLEAVVEAAGVERFPLLGLSQGGAIAIAYAVRHPERVSHLILYGSYARGKRHRNPSEAELLEINTLIVCPVRRKMQPGLSVASTTLTSWTWRAR